MLSSLLPGAIGGINLVLVGHPFDLVKVRLQTSTSSSLPHCLKKIYHTGGIMGFYQGVAAPLLGVIPIFALYYGVYRLSKDHLLAAQRLEAERATALAATLAASITAVVACPAERLKVLLQVAPSHQNTGLKGIWLLSQMLYRNGGVRTFYRGLSVMLLREVPSSIVYFSSYEYIKRGLKSLAVIDKEGKASADSIAPIIVAGGLAGMCSWLATAPLDTLKSIRQSEIARSPLSTWMLVASIWRREGVRGFYRGMVPALARAFPANAACFGGIEAVHHLLLKGRPL